MEAPVTRPADPYPTSYPKSRIVAKHDRLLIEQACRRHQVLLEAAVLDPGEYLAAALQASAASLQEQLAWLAVERLDLVAVGSLAELPWTSIAPGPVRMIIGTTPEVLPDRSRHLVAVGPRTDSAHAEAALISDRLTNLQGIEQADVSPSLLLDMVSQFDVLHLACHADHNHENPLLSSYQLHDGRLRGYEIERLTNAPRVVISSACTAGRQQLRGQLQMLGLPATWIAAGAESVIAPSCPIPDDERTAQTMAEIHRLLATGLAPEEAVFVARSQGDEVVAHALVTFGNTAASSDAKN